MSTPNDRTFIVTFLLVLGVLTGIALFASLVANILDSDDKNAVQIAKVDQNIQPIGQVNTDPAAEVLAPVDPHAEVKTYTGPELVAAACGGCHNAGTMGAPKIGDKAAWSARLSAAGGLDNLVASAIKGKNAMPPRGGSTASDAEIKAAVEEMIK